MGHFSKKLLQLRQKANMTQEEPALRIGWAVRL